MGAAFADEGVSDGGATGLVLPAAAAQPDSSSVARAKLTIACMRAFNALFILASCPSFGGRWIAAVPATGAGQDPGGRGRPQRRPRQPEPLPIRFQPGSKFENRAGPRRET